MPETCPECGSEIPAHGPAGMCPQCLLGLGLAASSDDGDDAPTGSGTPPSAVLTLPVGAQEDPGATLTPRAAPQGSSDTESLLRGRLQVGCWLIVLGVLAFVVRDVVSPDGEMSGLGDWVDRFGARMLLLLFYGASIGLLRSDRRLSLTQLRWLEAGILWAVALWFASDRVYWTRQSLLERNAADATFFVAFSFLTFFAFISAYGFFAPNTWRRALYMTGLIALLPVAVLGYVVYAEPGAAAFMREAGITGVKVSSLVMMLGIGVMIAAWGAHRIHTLRLEVREAKRLGQYRLVERIGRGGMGDVWKAEHRLLARPAAVKLVKAEVVGSNDPAVAHDFMRSFEREAQTTANLRSTHTVELYDFGVTSDGVFYYVMELLEGRDLESLVRDFGPLEPARAAYLLEQACDSLAEAHDQGLVHRDVKPANVQVCRLGRRYDFVKVLDFGLVKVRAHRGDDPRRGSSKVQIIGTPSYIAPEMAAGEEVDARADIYSLGCVGYWLLTGRPVFEGSNTAEIVGKHIEEAAVSPGRRADRQIPEALDALIMRCLDKDRDARPQSADELAQALRATGLTGEWSQEQARAWWQERDL